MYFVFLSLLYVISDDLVIIESSEEDLQKSLDLVLVGNWCEANALTIKLILDAL